MKISNPVPVSYSKIVFERNAAIAVRASPIQLSLAPCLLTSQVVAAKFPAPPTIRAQSNIFVSETLSNCEIASPSPSSTAIQPSSSCDKTLERWISDPNYDSSGFVQLKFIPESKRKNLERPRDKLTKALSGSEAIEILKERLEKKQAER